VVVSLRRVFMIVPPDLGPIQWGGMSASMNSKVPRRCKQTIAIKAPFCNEL